MKADQQAQAIALLYAALVNLKRAVREPSDDYRLVVEVIDQFLVEVARG